jgi:hypothetical protein
MSRVKVFIPSHARRRIQQRGGDVGTIAAASRRAATQVARDLRGSRRLAVDISRLPEVVPVIEVSAPEGKAPRAVVKTVLPFDAPSLASMEVVRVY